MTTISSPNLHRQCSQSATTLSNTHSYSSRQLGPYSTTHEPVSSRTAHSKLSLLNKRNSETEWQQNGKNETILPSRNRTLPLLITRLMFDQNTRIDTLYCSKQQPVAVLFQKCPDPLKHPPFITQTLPCLSTVSLSSFSTHTTYPTHGALSKH